MASNTSEFFRQLWALRSILLVTIVICACLPIILVIEEAEMEERARKCLYVMAVMAILWLTETIPISVTALLPIVMFPLAGVMTAKDTSSAYITDTSMLFLGGLIVAVAVEEWGLHKRIAMLVMLCVGSDPKWVLAGMMLPTWFLSMWISNTATTSMMIPIAHAVLQQIKDVKRDNSNKYLDRRASDASSTTANGVIPLETLDKMASHRRPSLEVEPPKEGEENNDKMTDQEAGLSDPETDIKEDRRTVRLSKAFTLCIAYAANIGGIATLTGTPPNLVLKGIADDFYLEAQKATGAPLDGSPISYSNWMGLAVPLSAITLILGWLVLIIFFLSGKGCCTVNRAQSAAIKKVVREEWRKLGRVSMAEIEVLILFVLLATLWISRDPKESPGWTEWFKTGFVSDSTTAMLISVLLFILPAKIPNVFWWRSPARAKEPYFTPILTWSQVNRKLPWGVIILLGGGFALAKGVTQSGLSKWLASKLSSLDYLDTWVLNLVLCLIVAVFTEVTSNTATATLLMPILANLAISLDTSVLYFMVSSAIATSFAFMLPAATPPNAIVFSYGTIRVIDMASVGIFMNCIAVGALTLGVNTWGKLIYDFDDLDDVFKASVAQSS